MRFPLSVLVLVALLSLAGTAHADVALSGAEIGGIVIALVIAVAVIAGGIWLVRRRKR